MKVARALIPGHRTERLSLTRGRVMLYAYA